MITSVHTERMVVISDLHLGNPFSKIRRQVIAFLRWAAEQNYDICINGDGLEIAQASFKKIAFEVPEFLRVLGDIQRKGQNVYYITGNHDIALEHFLEDWGVMKVTPFLNVISAKTRIRIEHGHIYDPFFVKHPLMYEFLTHFAGYLLKLHPSLYKFWISFEKWKSRLRARRTGIVGEHPSFMEAAHELSRRGFDVIVFGHTHHPGTKKLQDQGVYINSGSLMLSNHFVNIEKGVVELRCWEPSSKAAI